MELPEVIFTVNVVELEGEMELPVKVAVEEEVEALQPLPEAEVTVKIVSSE